MRSPPAQSALPQPSKPNMSCRKANLDEIKVRFIFKYKSLLKSALGYFVNRELAEP